MSRRRTTGILAAAAVLIALAVGGTYLAAGPADSDDVLHRLPGLQVEHAARVVEEGVDDAQDDEG